MVDEGGFIWSIYLRNSQDVFGRDIASHSLFVRGKDHGTRVVEVYTNSSVRQRIAHPVFVRIVQPRRDEDFRMRRSLLRDF